MTNDRLSKLVSAALRAQRKAAFDQPVKRMDPAIVDIICSTPPDAVKIQLPARPSVDRETRMAARNGLDEGLPPELLAELEDLEAKDQEEDHRGLDGA